jgi:TRAP-type C4-dicarboxylate transport system permease small subunit
VKKLKEFGKKVFDIYFGIGVAALALLAVLVIFAVIMRYFFSKSWKELSEFNVTLFAFTTFWGMGINVIKNEHVVIDILYNTFKPGVKRVVNVINLIITLIVDLVFTYQGFKYVAMAGKQISMGMEIPMKYMYGIMPISGVLCAICLIIKLIDCFMPAEPVTAE